MSFNYYVPILKWKKGEQEALKKLKTKQKQGIMPLIEIIDHEDPNDLLSCIENCFPYPFYIDTTIAEQDSRDFLFEILKTFKKNEKSIFPVLNYLDFPDNSSKIISIVDRLAVRVPIPEDLEGPNYQELFETIEDFISINNTGVYDIILDLGEISDKNAANSQLRELKYILQDFFINKKYYNRIIISSTSFPEDISTLSAGEKISFHRYDFKLFQKIFQMFTELQNKFVYSDYGVTKFTDTDIDFSKLRYGILPKVKYTTFDKYIVLKGKRDHSTRQMVKSYIDLSKDIYESDFYFGEDFSFGDFEIKERARKNKGPGSNTNWVTTGANHHIAVVIEQLSKIV